MINLCILLSAFSIKKIKSKANNTALTTQALMLPSMISSAARWQYFVSENNVGFTDNWTSFEGKDGLLGQDGIHPT